MRVKKSIVQAELLQLLEAQLPRRIVLIFQSLQGQFTKHRNSTANCKPTDGCKFPFSFLEVESASIFIYLRLNQSQNVKSTIH